MILTITHVFTTHRKKTVEEKVELHIKSYPKGKRL